MKNINVKKLVLSSIFLALAIILQLIGRSFTAINPLLVGPLINTLLLLTAYICGMSLGILVGVFTPIFAIITSVLAPPMIPFSPFIIIGNILFVIGFSIFMSKKKFGLYIGVIVASLVKYGFLTLASSKLIHLINLGIAPKVAAKIGVMFSTPQLINCLIGGAVAIILIKLLEKRQALPIDK